MAYTHLNQVPDYVKKIQEILLLGGGKPYIVGGAVRDLLMGKTPHDYDIASDLTPSEVIEILKDRHFPVVDKLGNNFGVVVGLIDNNPVEIATFRSDIYGMDAHRPDEVVFCKSIDADLARRDFTMNAMAMDAEGYIVDPFGGQKDIKQKVVRPVGDASKRYQEDPLRMYRACRFLAQLGFSYKEGLEESDVFVRKDFWKKTRAENLSMERVRNEISRLLTSPYPKKGLSLFMSSGLTECPCLIKTNGKEEKVYPFACLTHLNGLEQNPKYHKFDAWGHTMEAVENISPHLILRFTMLFHDAGKGLEGIRAITNGQPSDHRHEYKSANLAVNSLTSLGYKNSFIRETKELILSHMDGFYLKDASDRQIKRWLKKQASTCRTQSDLMAKVNYLSKVFFADSAAGKQDLSEIKQIMDKMEIVKEMSTKMPVHSSDLHIEGKTVKEIADKYGADLKEVYQSLIMKVQDGIVPNEKEALENSLEKQMKRWEEKSKKLRER